MPTLLVLIDTDYTVSNGDLVDITTLISDVLGGDYNRIDIEGFDGVTREGILRDVVPHYDRMAEADEQAREAAGDL